MKVYPIFLNNLVDRRCVVIGGDHEAERKVKGLLACDADVVVISPDLTDELGCWADAGRFEWIARPYRHGDLKDAFLTIISETNPEATAPIWEEAQAEKVLINAMDDVPHCTFVAGSVVRRGPLVISISTSGQGPTLSVRLRQQLEKELGPEYAVLLEWMAALREPVAERYPDFDERRRRWYALVDSDLLEMLRQGNLDAAQQCIDDIMGEGLGVYDLTI
jgi:siroheme synthase-like protein